MNSTFGVKNMLETACVSVNQVEPILRHVSTKNRHLVGGLEHVLFVHVLGIVIVIDID